MGGRGQGVRGGWFQLWWGLGGGGLEVVGRGGWVGVKG